MGSSLKWSFSSSSFTTCGLKSFSQSSFLYALVLVWLSSIFPSLPSPSPKNPPLCDGDPDVENLALTSLCLPLSRQEWQQLLVKLSINILGKTLDGNPGPSEDPSLISTRESWWKAGVIPNHEFVIRWSLSWYMETTAELSGSGDCEETTSDKPIKTRKPYTRKQPRRAELTNKVWWVRFN